VADAAVIIARGVGLSAAQVERVRIAALLHDIGKIDEIYAPILRKEGKLTAEEWAIMKTHPVKSAELVATLSDLRDVVGPVRHHHEHWDGRGYPDGLRGEQIPLAARIITFADTMDALTTDRPYRRALGEPEVRSEFAKNCGTQFDPTICGHILSPSVWAQLFPSSQIVQRVVVTPASSGQIRVVAS
jgi:HD-GYP domain-containing protein (c-di-GMP phosphodiesterase class II)